MPVSRTILNLQTKLGFLSATPDGGRDTPPMTKQLCRVGVAAPSPGDYKQNSSVSAPPTTEQLAAQLAATTVRGKNPSNDTDTTNNEKKFEERLIDFQRENQNWLSRNPGKVVMPTTSNTGQQEEPIPEKVDPTQDRQHYIKKKRASSRSLAPCKSKKQGPKNHQGQGDEEHSIAPSGFNPKSPGRQSRHSLIKIQKIPKALSTDKKEPIQPELLVTPGSTKIGASSISASLSSRWLHDSWKNPELAAAGDGTERLQSAREKLRRLKDELSALTPSPLNFITSPLKSMKEVFDPNRRKINEQLGLAKEFLGKKDPKNPQWLFVTSVEGYLNKASALLEKEHLKVKFSESGLLGRTHKVTEL